jgi:hypothetical protein
MGKALRTFRLGRDTGSLPAARVVEKPSAALRALCVTRLGLGLKKNWSCSGLESNVTGVLRREINGDLSI